MVIHTLYFDIYLFHVLWKVQNNFNYFTYFFNIKDLKIKNNLDGIFGYSKYFGSD